MLRELLKSTARFSVWSFVLAMLACQSPSSAQQAPGAGMRKSQPVSTAACMISNLDLHKAEEIGASVAASGKKWRQTPDGGIAELSIFSPSEPRELFVDAAHAESLVVLAMGDAADKCDVDDTEFELGAGYLDGFQRGVFSHDAVKRLHGRGAEVFDALRKARKALLTSREFQLGYQRFSAERTGQKK